MGTRAHAEAYLQYLYSPEGQEIAARNFYRPRLESVAKKVRSDFCKGEAVYPGRSDQRLAKGTGHSLCPWRSFRPDLSAEVAEGGGWSPDVRGRR